jgi:RNA polymerase sigma-70 factor (ECF subfamily)
MDAQAREELEQAIRAHCEGGRHGDAATVAIEGYGPEILGYLTTAAGSGVDPDEAFSMFCERLWRGLPKFHFAASFRTWAYTVARHALVDLARDPQRRRAVVTPSQAPEIAEIVQQVRSSTVQHLRTETKTQVARLREALEPDDRTLLILRVDRDMPWDDIAAVLHDGDDEPDAVELRRRSAALRKRFERVKERLRKLAAADSE